MLEDISTSATTREVNHLSGQELLGTIKAAPNPCFVLWEACAGESNLKAFDESDGPAALAHPFLTCGAQPVEWAHPWPLGGLPTLMTLSHLHDLPTLTGMNASQARVNTAQHREAKLHAPYKIYGSAKAAQLEAFVPFLHKAIPLPLPTGQLETVAEFFDVAAKRIAAVLREKLGVDLDTLEAKQLSADELARTRRPIEQNLIDLKGNFPEVR